MDRIEDCISHPVDEGPNLILALIAQVLLQSGVGSHIAAWWIEVVQSHCYLVESSFNPGSIYSILFYS